MVLKVVTYLKCQMEVGIHIVIQFASKNKLENKLSMLSLELIMIHCGLCQCTTELVVSNILNVFLHSINYYRCVRNNAIFVAFQL